MACQNFGIWVLYDVMNNFKWSVRYFFGEIFSVFFSQKENVSGNVQRKSFLIG